MIGTSRASERPTEASGGGRCPQCGKRIVRVSGCFEHGLPATTHREPRPPPAGRSGRPTFPGFRVTRALGWGGFGVVYAVERLTDGARLALKLARADIPGAACRLRREAEVLRAVGPPHVPTVHGEGVNESGAPYLLMDRIEAPTFTVGAICVIDRGDGHVLLVRHSYRDRWGFPGGLLKKGEEAADGARREAREEVGLAVELVGEPTVVVAPEPRRVDIVYRARVAPGADWRDAAPRSP